MNEELRLHIKKLEKRAHLSLLATLLIIFSIALGVIFVPSFVSVVFFAITILLIAYLIRSSRSAKEEAKANEYEPVKFILNRSFSFEDTISIFENMTDKENILSTSENVRFFRCNKIFRLRAIIYHTDNFNKKDFDNAKSYINKKANKELNITSSVGRNDAVKMMRFNIICTDKLNDALYKYISQNANRNLTRVEGIINIAIVGNEVIIPPIYGECDLAEIGRYKGVIGFVNRFFLNYNN